MSTQVPLRSMRIPTLQRQCLFLRHQSQSRPHNLSLRQPTISTARAFSSTPSRPEKHRQLGTDRAKLKAANQSNMGAAPSVGTEQAQNNLDSMQEDIGLLQNTIIRAPFRELWKHGLATLPVYFWKLVKSKGTGLYQRYLYRTCVQKTGWDKFLPIDLFNGTQFKNVAKKHYEHIYNSLAAGNVKDLKGTCLTPLYNKLESRVAARGKLRMAWQIHGNMAARIVSHRVTPLGESHPDTAYRQVVVRLKSTQSMTRSILNNHAVSSSSGPRVPRKALAWMPDAAREQMLQKRKEEVERGAVVVVDDVKQAQDKGVFFDNGVPQTVVEYLVLQQRVIRGEEEGWKVWGFAEETTPEVLKQEEAYWGKILEHQTM